MLGLGGVVCKLSGHPTQGRPQIPGHGPLLAAARHPAVVGHDGAVSRRMHPGTPAFACDERNFRDEALPLYAKPGAPKPERDVARSCAGGVREVTAQAGFTTVHHACMHACMHAGWQQRRRSCRAVIDHRLPSCPACEPAACSTHRARGAKPWRCRTGRWYAMLRACCKTLQETCMLPLPVSATLSCIHGAARHGQLVLAPWPAAHQTVSVQLERAGYRSCTFEAAPCHASSTHCMRVRTRASTVNRQTSFCCCRRPALLPAAAARPRSACRRRPPAAAAAARTQLGAASGHPAFVIRPRHASEEIQDRRGPAQARQPVHGAEKLASEANALIAAQPPTRPTTAPGPSPNNREQMSALRCALIETSEEEAYVAVAKYIAELRDGQQVRPCDGRRVVGPPPPRSQPPQHAMAPHPLPAPQTGAQSTFTDECEQLYAAEQHEKLLDKFMSALDAVFAAASSDAGACSRLPWCHALCYAVPLKL